MAVFLICTYSHMFTQLNVQRKHFIYCQWRYVKSTLQQLTNFNVVLHFIQNPLIFLFFIPAIFFTCNTNDLFYLKCNTGRKCMKCFFLAFSYFNIQDLIYYIFKALSRFTVLGFCFYSFHLFDVQKQALEVFYRKAILKHFTIFTGRHMCQSLFLIKLQA